MKAPTTIMALSALSAATLAARAAEVIKPQINEPLRDAAVTRSPDGTYYLTGTRAFIRNRPTGPRRNGAALGFSNPIDNLARYEQIVRLQLLPLRAV